MEQKTSMITAMIDGQIKPNKVNDPRIIEAFETTPREDFVPKALREVAYVDEDLEIAPGRYLMEPMILARLVELAKIGPNDVVLDIGCGSGYSTALLSRFAGVVVGLEENQALADKANENLQNLDIENGAVIKGPMNLGCARQGPYQVILLGGAVEVIPQTLFDQLAEGGRLVTVKIRNGVGRGHLVQKIGGILGNSDHFDANLPPLPGFQSKPEFRF